MPRVAAYLVMLRIAALPRIYGCSHNFEYEWLSHYTQPLDDHGAMVSWRSPHYGR